MYFRSGIQLAASQSRNESVKKQRDPKPHVNNNNTVTVN